MGRRNVHCRIWLRSVSQMYVIAAISLAMITAVRAEAVTAAADGLQLYRSYCAACHGTNGGGDGPDAAIFSPPPPDLRPLLRRYAIKDLVGRVRDGQHLELQLESERLRSQARTVEALSTYLHRLPDTNWRVVERGQELYVQRCEDCHGLRGQPGTGFAGTTTPPDLSDPGFQSSTSDADLIDLVRHGRKGMPALVPRVDATDAHALASFVRLFSPGFETYSRYCANCHGDDGRGRASLGEVVHPPMVVFDHAYFQRCDAECLRLAVWHMATESKPHMPHYRDVLSIAQARAIVIYLKSQAPKAH